MEPITTKQNEILFSENFNDGFAVTGEKVRWFYFASGALITTRCSASNRSGVAAQLRKK